MSTRLGGIGGVLVLFVVACSAERAGESGTLDSEFTKSDFAEDEVLPYSAGWVDAPKALAGVGQFDRLKGTIYDDAKCSTMVAIGAAIAGGEEHFVRLLNAVAKKREARRDDLDVIDRARVAVAAKKLTPRHLHELTEVIVRAWKLGDGAYDEQIAEMIRESGYAPVKVGTTKPRELVEHLREREVVPLSIVVPYEGERIPHITLLWKDARGTVRLYDSDDIGGSHVLPRGSAPYEDRLSRSDSSWDLAEKYR